jgi:oligopeptide transport system substrate-binding protein
VQDIIDGKATPDKLGVTAVDAHTLRVQLDKPLPWFANLAANFAFYPVQKANVESGRTGRVPETWSAMALMCWKAGW